ncbi:hypothetical protein MTO96_000836 [Rhipicephalus appendiculatus]
MFLSTDPDAHKNVSQLISSNGYPVEEHNVTTRDSYVIMMQRIPAGHSKRNGQSQRKRAVMLMSGLEGSSADYVLNKPDQSLGFILADKGFDVWLANVRGSSLDEMISHDLPDQVDAVLKMTQQENLLYVGFSQGTAIMFGLLASKPEYNKKIRLFNAFAPIALIGHMTAALRYFVPVSSPLLNVLQLIFKGALEEHKGSILSGLKDLTCSKLLPFCKVGFYAINGGFPVEWNQTRLPVFNAHFPSGSSVRNIAHFAQLVKSNRLQKYDWGHTKNVAIYGTPWPPTYNLANVKAPVVLYWSDGDVLAAPRDVEDLAKILPNVVLNYKVPVSGFTHLDFGLSINAKDHLYKKVLEMMSKYSKN